MIPEEGTVRQDKSANFGGITAKVRVSDDKVESKSNSVVNGNYLGP